MRRFRLFLLILVLQMAKEQGDAAETLSDYGGDVDQYMSLLQSTSALTFGPKRSTGGDFGGEYGDYLHLLESDSALGYNPQTDPVSDNQELQTDVFGGGMSGKFWDMYKGTSSYADGDGGFDEDEVDELRRRQAGEVDQPENRGNRAEKTVLVTTYKPSDGEMADLIKKVEQSLKAESKKTTSSRSTDEPQDEKEEQNRRKSAAVVDRLEKEMESFVGKIREIVPDPVMSHYSYSMNFRNLTLFGVSDVSQCGRVRKSALRKWRTDVCSPALAAAVNSVAGAGVPFKGKVTALFKRPKITLTLRESAETFRIVGLRLKSSATKFVPTFDSSVPLNPWSKVSMSGYLVARVKKSLPPAVEKTLLKLFKVVKAMKAD